jgi:hypothetical protein
MKFGRQLVESKSLSFWLSDGRNFVIALLSTVVCTLSLLIAIATVASISAQTPYERKDAADAALAELRSRMNTEFENQIVINDDLYAQLDELESQLGQTPIRHQRRNKGR